jgi:ribose 5-phosphate isomerase RpiB
MRIGIATDHGGFGLKEDLGSRLTAAGHNIVDFGANRLEPGDDYLDFVIPLARAGFKAAAFGRSLMDGRHNLPLCMGGPRCRIGVVA